MKYIVAVLFSSFLFSSCFVFYTFKDISIEPDVKTFYVDDFENNAVNSPASLNQDFSEDLRKKVVNETSLNYSEFEPHIVFSGAVSSFSVRAQAPNQDGASLNRLEIKIKVEFTNSLHEKEDWNKTFSYYADFPSDKSLDDVQDALINEIFEHILEEIINKSFNNW